MKNILITGANSYIGDSLARWLQEKPNEYTVDILDVKDSAWQKHGFSKYNSVVNVAGIAHIKETKKNKELYYKVNRDLAYEIAQKAKNEGVKQFIFFSSMSVYGVDTGVITRNTVPRPKSNYGKSKFEAEQLINALNDDNFRVAIVRPPMVYGKECKGNYSLLSKYASKIPFFPDVKNQRSMLYVDNLSEIVRKIIDEEIGGLYLPQNKEYVCITELIKVINEVHGRNIILTSIFNPLIKILRLKIFNKIFGSLTYEKDFAFKDCILYDFKKSIELTEVK